MTRPTFYPLAAGFLVVAAFSSVGCGIDEVPPEVMAPSLAPPDPLCATADYGGKNYFFCPTLRTWASARSTCQAIGYDLATIDSVGENQFVLSKLLVNAWIGANDVATEGTWRWASSGNQFWQGAWNGSAVGGAYRNWGVLQPDNFLNQDCAMFLGGLGLGKWSDENCSLLANFICEGDLCPSDPSKTEPGQCGCGVPDTDTDGDGTADCVDVCVFDAAKTAQGKCGCNVSDVDTDADGVADCFDQCPTDPRYVVEGDCGCSDNPKPQGTVCDDGLCAANTECDGAGTCGDPQECKPDSACALHYFQTTPYWFCDNDRGYENAIQRCQTSGMELAMIESAEEDAFITSKMHEHSFVGGSDQAVEGTWTWETSGTPFWTGGPTGSASGGAYTNFALLEPSNLLPATDCMIKSVLSGGQWKAHSCSLCDAYVCERVDLCPGDPSKRYPGQCGCGIPDSDFDGDGVADCRDGCMYDPSKSGPGTCGCGEPDTDTDADGVADCVDECPLDADLTAGGKCGCPSDPEPSGMECNDGICGAGECDGSGHCGDLPSTCSPDPSCSCTVIRVDGVAYWFCPCAKGRAAAEAACASSPGGHLLEITGPSQNAIVAARLTGETWIGANDRAVEGEFRWATPARGDNGMRFWNGDANGAPHFGRYSNWQATEPGGGTASNCVTMSAASGTRGQWLDVSCTATAHVACEVGLDRLTSAPLSQLPSASEILGQDPTTTRDDVNCTPLAQAFDEPDNEAILQQLRECTACVSTPGATEADCFPDPLNPMDPAPCQGSAAPPSIASTCAGLDVGLPPEHKFVCALVPDSWGAAPVERCEVDPITGEMDPCAGGKSCGLVFSCTSCAAGEICPCTRDTEHDPPLVGECPGIGNRCVGQKVCGQLIPECPTLDVDEGNNNQACDEIEICASDTLRAEATFTAMNPESNLETVTLDEIDMQFDPPFVPADALQFPEDPPCDGDPSNCPSSAEHKWCRYETPQGLPDQKVESPMRVGEAGGSETVEFKVEPDMDYGYKLFPGPLGLMQFELDAHAGLTADVGIHVLEVDASMRVIEFLLDVRGGLHDDAEDDLQDVCGLSTDRSQLLILEQFDVLPTDFRKRIPADGPGGGEIHDACIQGLKDFQDAVNRAKKAYRDARELLRQYHDPDLVALGATFGTGLDGFCDQIASSLPLGFPPALRDNCLSLAPEEVLNAFIDYYVQTARETLATTVTNQVKGSLDAAFDAAKAGIPLDPVLANTEELTLFNDTFPVGPIPVNLQVLLTASYSLSLTAEAKFQPSSLIATILNPDPVLANPREPFAYVGVNATPSAGAGIALFAGAGFDVGIAAAAIGIQGSVSLGKIGLPIMAGAGIAIASEPDSRPLSAEDMAAGSYVSKSSTDAVIPKKKYSINATYKFGATLQLRDVLHGSLDVVVKLKFLFFSRKWKAHIASFSGFCREDNPMRESFCDTDLFGGYGVLAAIPFEIVDWGTVLQPTAFLKLEKIIGYRAPGGVSIDTGAVGELFYDALCTCIPRPEDAPGETLEPCSISSDCCGYETGDFCFHDPADSFKGTCSTCRSTGESCRTVADCCATEGPQTCMQIPGPENYKTCQPKSACGGPCNNLDDCDQATAPANEELECFGLGMEFVVPSCRVAGTNGASCVAPPD